MPPAELVHLVLVVGHLSKQGFGDTGGDSGGSHFGCPIDAFKSGQGDVDLMQQQQQQQQQHQQ